MSVTTSLLVAAALAAPSQTPPPASDPAAPPAVEAPTPAADADAPPPAADADAPPPVAEPPPPQEALPPPTGDATAAPGEATTTFANPRHWQVTIVDVPVSPGSAEVRKEVRVLRGDGSPVSVGEGLADVQLSKRLTDRAQAAEGSGNTVQSVLGRAVVLGAGAVLTVVGVIAAGVGGVFSLMTRSGGAGVPEALAPIVVQGPSILLTGLIAASIGLFTVAATGALWAWYALRGPPPPDPSVVQALGASLGWDEKEAQEVISLHNARVDGEAVPAAAPAEPAPETPPASETAPAPEMPPAPETAPAPEMPPAPETAPPAEMPPPAAEPAPAAPLEPAPATPAPPAP